MNNLLNELVEGREDLRECSIEELEAILISMSKKQYFDYDLYNTIELIVTQGAEATPEIDLDLSYILKNDLIPEDEKEGIFYIEDNYYSFIRTLPLDIVFSNDLRYYVLDWLDYLNKDEYITDYTIDNIDFDFIYPNEIR